MGANLSITAHDLLREIVAVREKLLQRLMNANVEQAGAVSKRDIDLARLDVLEAKLRLLREEDRGPC